jgi:hypothetical protein
MASTAMKKPRAEPKPVITAAMGPRYMEINMGTWDPKVAVKGGTTTLKTTTYGIIIAIAVSRAVITSFLMSIYNPPS